MAATTAASATSAAMASRRREKRSTIAPTGSARKGKGRRRQATSTPTARGPARNRGTARIGRASSLMGGAHLADRLPGPQQVEVGRKMHVGFQHVGVHFDLERSGRSRGLAHKHVAAGRRDQDIDLFEQRCIHQGHVVAEGLVDEPVGLGPPRV